MAKLKRKPPYEGLLQKRPAIRDGRKSREVAVPDGITTLG
jgi:hypothetical protein